MREPRCGRLVLIGDPVAASVSPDMQRAAFAAAGLDLGYEAVTVRARDLAAVFPLLRAGFLGANVTTPLKEAVLELCDDVGDEAARARSVNTLVFEGGRARGESTDGAGFMRALAQAGVPATGCAVVVGTGGAARAVAAALARGGMRVVVSGRNAEAGERVASEVDGCTFVAPHRLGAALREATLLVNATPLGGTAAPAALPVERRLLHPGLAVFDLVYRPRRTPLLRAAEEAGCTVVEGVEMLIEQGAGSFELWTGRPAPVDVMRAAAHRALDEARV